MHRISNLILSFCFLVTLLTPIHQGYSQDWIHGIKAEGSDQSGGLYHDSDMAVDETGNIVIAGQYNNSISFGEHTISTDNGSYPDIFLCRIGADRNVQWLKHIEAGSNNAEELAVSIDSDNNIYLTGSMDGYLFVSKYDSLGDLIWSQNFQNEVYGYGTTIKTDMYDNVYVAGGDGWTFFMSKLSNAGEVVWLKDIWVNYSDGCTVTDIAVDATGNIYFAGRMEINLPLDDITLEYTGSSGPNVFWGRMDSTGEFTWAKAATGRSTDRISIALTSDGHLLLAGGVSGNSVTFDSQIVYRGNCCQGATGFLAKSDLEGTILWAKPSTENYYGSVPLAMEVEHNGNIYVTGSYFTCTGTSCTEIDFYVEKYDKDGTPVWRSDYASTDTETAKAIDVDNNGLVYVLGVNSSTSFIDPNEWSPTRTYGVGIFDSGSSTYKGTPRPHAEGLIEICDEAENDESKLVTVSGENVRWYDDAFLSNKIADGNQFAVSTAKSDTLYVTQTANAVESWPKPIIIKLISLPEGNLIVENDSMRAPIKDGVSYQWLYNSTPIPNGTDYFIKVDTTQHYDKFSVRLSEGPCQKILTEIEIITSIQDEEETHRLKAYPNPTASTVIIQLNNAVISDVLVADVLGKKTDAPVLVSASELTVDLTNEQAGLYVVQLLLNKKRVSLKVIKR